MGTCPNCGTSTRHEPEAFTFERVLVAKPIGTFSLAGVTPKVSAVDMIQMTCRCGLAGAGHYEGDYLVFDRLELDGQPFTPPSTAPRAGEPQTP